MNSQTTRRGHAGAGLPAKIAAVTSALVLALGVGFATPARAAQTCSSNNGSQYFGPGAQLELYVTWDVCGSETSSTVLNVNHLHFSGNGRTYYASLVIMRYSRAGGQLPVVINWQQYCGSTSFCQANGNPVTRIDRNLQPYAYVKYATSSSGPWSDSPVIRMS